MIMSTCGSPLSKDPYQSDIMSESAKPEVESLEYFLTETVQWDGKTADFVMACHDILVKNDISVHI